MSVQTDHGLITSIGHGRTVYPFRSEPEHAGPAFHITYGGQERVGLPSAPDETGWSRSLFWGMELCSRVEETESGARIRVRIVNHSSQCFRPDRVCLTLGVDTYMDRFPEWNDKVFPTLLRCEKTHFWGYFRSPSGHVLGIASPDPIPGWQLKYNHYFSDGGHRIHTAELILMTADPLPERHPKLEKLLPGQEAAWTVEFFDAPDLHAALRVCSRICQAPVFDTERLIFEKEEAHFRFYCPGTPAAKGYEPIKIGEDTWEITIPPSDREGLYRLSVGSGGKTAEISYFRHGPWGRYLRLARRAALSMPQKTGSHCESWYGLFSGLQAARYVPDPKEDAEILCTLEKLLPLSFDTQNRVPLCIPERIQNTAVAVSLCEDAYQVTNDRKWLWLGGGLADWLIDRCQGTDGAFRSGKTHYTCVIYIAKSILELYLAEKSVGMPGAEKHFSAAKRAVDELVLHLDNIGTEGEHTFEDGMISCSVAQIAMMALLLPREQRQPYIDGARILLQKHRCLERLGSPDARSRNTTLRFWEAQYDVLIPANMINSPHGWSAWKIYGVWYLYLLTGETDDLVDAMETLGSCAQLMGQDGKLRWAFTPDPCVSTGKWVRGEDGGGKLEKCVLGEEYIDMISDWYRAPDGKAVYGYLGCDPRFETDQGGCCDNDVHEIFKAMAEIAVPYAYLAQTDQKWLVYHAELTGSEENMTLIPAEETVRAVHVNLKREAGISVRFTSGTVQARLANGWILDSGEVRDDPFPFLP